MAMSLDRLHLELAQYGSEGEEGSTGTRYFGDGGQISEYMSDCIGSLKVHLTPLHLLRSFTDDSADLFPVFMAGR